MQSHEKMFSLCYHANAFYTAQKLKFCIKIFFCKCDQIRSFLRIWSHLLMKSLLENLIFCAAVATLTSYELLHHML